MEQLWGCNSSSSIEWQEGRWLTQTGKMQLMGEAGSFKLYIHSMTTKNAKSVYQMREALVLF